MYSNSVRLAAVNGIINAIIRMGKESRFSKSLEENKKAVDFMKGAYNITNKDIVCALLVEMERCNPRVLVGSMEDMHMCFRSWKTDRDWYAKSDELFRGDAVEDIFELVKEREDKEFYYHIYESCRPLQLVYWAPEYQVYYDKDIDTLLLKRRSVWYYQESVYVDKF